MFIFLSVAVEISGYIHRKTNNKSSLKNDHFPILTGGI